MLLEFKSSINLCTLGFVIKYLGMKVFLKTLYYHILSQNDIRPRCPGYHSTRTFSPPWESQYNVLFQLKDDAMIV